MIMLIDALVEKYGKAEGLTLHDDVIMEWPYAAPQPSKEELATLSADYVKRKGYISNRLKEIPSVSEMLLNLWEAIDAGTPLKQSKFYTAIKQVMDKYPQPKE